MESYTTAIRTVKAPTLPTRPEDDDADGYAPTAEDEAWLLGLSADDDAPVPDWVEDGPEPFDEEEHRLACDAAARDQSARFHAWCDAGRPREPMSDHDRLAAYLIHPETATWLAYTGGHERF